MHQDRQYLPASRPELLVEKRFLDLPSIGMQQGEPAKHWAFDLSRKSDGEAKQVRGDLGARRLDKNDAWCRLLGVSRTCRNGESDRAEPSTEMHGAIPMA